MAGKITSFIPDRCSWCLEIRQKYSIRQKIATILGLEPITQDIVEYACCPFHRTTVHFDPLDKKSEIIIEDNKVIAHWWTNSYDYKLIFDIETRTCHWETDYVNSYLPSKRFDFDALFRELIMWMNKEQLEKTLEIAKRVTEKKPIEYIMQKFSRKAKEEQGELEIDGEKYRYTKVLVLECEDKPITSVIQGFFEYNGEKYYKRERYVYKLGGE